MGLYDSKPERLLTQLCNHDDQAPEGVAYCAGFELEQWRCQGFADHLIEWLPDYALREDELATDHANAFVQLRRAAVRVYTSNKYEQRGEVGEIALHAICRDFFDTIPISPRVFHKSASNDVVKSFDMVHAKFLDSGKIELWLGESKLYKDAKSAIAAAVASIKEHIEKGFLVNQKLLLGPQIPKSTPHYEEVRKLFAIQTSLDDFVGAAVFVVAILTDSAATAAAKGRDDAYIAAASQELGDLAAALKASGLCEKLKLVLLYVPLGDKDLLVKTFDARLKALQ